MNKDNPEPDTSAPGIFTVTGQARPLPFSYGIIKNAKGRVLESLSGSGAATVVEVVTDTSLPFELASVVIGELETEGKVTVEIAEGLKWVQLKK